MSLVEGVLQEEFNRLTALKEKYLTCIAQFPKGALVIKKRFHKEYVYLSYRDQEKVVSNYIGQSDSEEAQQLTVQINQRKDYEEKLKKVRQNLKEVKSALRNRK